MAKKSNKANIPFVKNANTDWIIPEGRHIFKVTDVEYDDEDGMLELEFTTYNGKTLTKKFTLKDDDGEWKEKVLGFVSYLFTKILKVKELESLSPDDVKGEYVSILITHSEYDRKDNKGKGTRMDISKFEEADGFDTEEVKTTKDGESASESLKRLLGR